MKQIVATDRNWGIGKDNDLLCQLPGDLQYFRDKTKGKVVIFGRKTLESLPGGKPLPGRDHIILTGDMEYTAKPRKGFACDICHSKDEVMELVRKYEAEGKEVVVCGGSAIYDLFLEDCDEFLVTRIDEVFGADRFYPNLEEKGFTVAWESEEQEENGIRYTFKKYVR